MALECADRSCLPIIDAMRAACIAHMRATGIDQWDEVYPTADVVLRDCDEGNLFVLKDAEGVIVGCGTLDQRQSPEYASVEWLYRPPRIGVVHRLMILPACQGKGYAKLLMRGIEEEARQRSYHAMRLDAFVQNPAAMALYSGLGYRVAGEVRFRKGAFACFEKEPKRFP